MGWPKGVPRKAKVSAPTPVVISRTPIRPVPPAPLDPDVERIVHAMDTKSMSVGEVQRYLYDRLKTLNAVIRRTKQFDWMIGGLSAIENDMNRFIAGRKDRAFGRSA